MQKYSDLFGIPKKEEPPRTQIRLKGNGDLSSGGSGTVFVYTTVVEQTGDDIILNGVNDSVNGTSFQIQRDGVYAFRLQFGYTGAAVAVGMGFTVNATELTTGLLNFVDTDRILGLVHVLSDTADTLSACNVTAYLKAGDIVRPQVTVVTPPPDSADNDTTCSAVRIA